MSTAVMTALLAGGFGLGGVLGGALLTDYLSRRTQRRQFAAEDDRRWQTDRRILYAKYLATATSMLNEIDGTASLLTRENEPPMTTEDEEIVKDDVLTYYGQWDELQVTLGELQMLSSPAVAELADRTSWALMNLVGEIDSRQDFDSVYRLNLKTVELIQAMRNAMRAELGLPGNVNTFFRPEWLDWPWLEDGIEPKEPTRPLESESE